MKPIAIGGDIFAGLFTLGVKQAGFNVAAQLEHSDYGAKTCQANFPKLDLRLNGPENWNLRTLPKDIDLFYSNPPCAPWSNWNSGSASWRSDPRIKWVDDLIETAIKLRTKTFIWESVPSTWVKGRPFTLKKAKVLIEAKYHVTVLLQNNMYLGAPQNRKRMMLIGHKYPLIWPAFYEPKTLEEWLDTAPDGIVEGLEHRDATPWERRLWRMSKRLNGYLSRAAHALTLEERQKNYTPSYMVARLSPDKAPPLMSEHRFHPHEPRKLTLKELRHLNGLPENWINETCSYVGAAGEMMRAVLPPVGKWVATAVKRGLKKDPLPVRQRQVRCYDCRKPDHVLNDLVSLATID
jgi:DNA (cytosine-5)-methyltransferase 1